jgi:hypothetical protein
MLDDLQVIGFHNVRQHDAASTAKNRYKTVHFFKQDRRIEVVYTDFEKYLPVLRPYKQVTTPDFSAYTDMQLWRQLESVAHSRWCGAYWQAHGLTVIPAITWAQEDSFEFCFAGVEEGASVIVSTIGAKKAQALWLAGFRAMVEKIKPETVLCYCRPFPEVCSLVNTTYIPHEAETAARYFPGQIEFDFRRLPAKDMG